MGSVYRLIHWMRPLESVYSNITAQCSWISGPVGVDRWMEIGDKQCPTGLVTIFLGLTECQRILLKLLLN